MTQDTAGRIEQFLAAYPQAAGYSAVSVMLPCPRCAQPVQCWWTQRPGYAKNDVWVIGLHAGCGDAGRVYNRARVGTRGLQPPVWARLGGNRVETQVLREEMCRRMEGIKIGGGESTSTAPVE